MKRVSILGSTGSIGTQALDLIQSHPELFDVVSLACGKNIPLLEEQALMFRPKVVSCMEESDSEKLKNKLSSLLPETEFLWGEEGLIRSATMPSDIVLNALVGIRGLIPTCAALKNGLDVALANKETLVAAGPIVMKVAEEYGSKILPVDSEHSAIFQCLRGNEGDKIRRIILTASGGPFRGMRREELENVTPEQALKHPNWSMGRKISIDSATLMNKGLEVIEASVLFDVDQDDIDVTVHPESIIHSAVEFEDKAILAQLGPPDMRIPIGFALAYPNRLEFQEPGLDLFSLKGGLTFEKPDIKNFPCLGIALEAFRRGGTFPAVMNAANEIGVEAFLEHKIGFNEIPNIVEKVMVKCGKALPIERFSMSEADSLLNEILEGDSEARIEARDLVDRIYAKGRIGI
jgi:1-deoxy-D-xylulose-5-phosphate reductoisomerase